jgi:Xaa-Pro dipeptidase
MTISRRSLFRRGGAALGIAGFTGLKSIAQEKPKDPFAELKSMTGSVQKLTPEDFQSRLEKARRLMIDHKIDLLYLNGGTSMEYFGGIRWGLSERMFAMLIPARGDTAYVCPKFEEGRGSEQIRFGTDIRTWEEDQSPYLTVKEILKDRSIASGTIAIEPSVREFVVDGMQKVCPAAKFIDGEAISQGCRMIKTKKELDYMALASEITQKAYDAAFRTLREGMTAGELSRNISLAHTRLGASGGAMVGFGPNAAFPHGSVAERPLKSGDVVLADGGCRVEGFQSDVTRTVVFGKPTEKTRQVWDIVKKAQDSALAAARPGVPCEAVDAAARKVIVDAGFGPDYKYFTHRLGHGIGMDGHEYPYLVRGNKLPLQAGMTFSDEPGIYIVGEFGVRTEDVMAITEDGARLFRNTTPVLETY